MEKDGKCRIFVFCLILVLVGPCLSSVLEAKNTPPDMKTSGRFPDGQILFTPFYSTTTYLINGTGAVNHTWSSAYAPRYASYWLGNGTILLPIDTGSGGFQEIAWNGTVIWDYRFSRSGCCCHHDVKPLPNGNVLMIVQEIKTPAQAIAAGRDPATIENSFFPDFLIEVHQTGPSSGTIVWEWHQWDHLIQDFDSTKNNYGVVGDHPELIDINFGEYFYGDWIHTNSVDYNPAFDQILISAHNFDEVWIIDHSTTTEEAAGHTGGHYGHGGDLLYRWGNPQAYQRGNASDKKLFFQHQCIWIKPRYPGEGDILIFDNGNNRPGGPYSTADEFTPPVDSNGSYYLEPGSVYGPENYTWSYTAVPPGSLYSDIFGGVQRLPDGDTLICDGVPGKFIEVTPEKTVVWEYVNPYPWPTMSPVFKIEYICPMPPLPPPKPDLYCIGRLVWVGIQPGVNVTGSFQVQNFGDPGSRLNWTVNLSSLMWGKWTITPSSGVDLTPEEGPVSVQVNVIAPGEKNAEFHGALMVQNKENASDFGTIPITLTTPLINSLPPAHPFMNMVRQWLSFLKDVLKRAVALVEH